MQNTTRSLGIIGIIILLIGSSFVFILFFRNKVPDISEVRNLDSGGLSLVVFGDSITAGYGVGEKFAYPALLSREVGLPILNAGRNGDTMASALTRVQSDVLDKDPWIVIVFFGGNDFIRRIPRSELKKNLITIVQKVQGAGAIVVIVGIRTAILTDNYESAYKEVAEEYKTAYVPDVLDGIFSKETIENDPIHPNARGHEIIAERILKVLEPIVAESLKYR